MYFFVTASLPDIVLGEEPELPLSEFLELLGANLSKDDFEKINVLRRLVDLDNIRCFLKEEPLKDGGSFSQKEIEEALLSKAGLPEYVFEVLAKYDTAQDKVQGFTEVFIRFFREEADFEKGFLKRYFAFERALRFCLTAFRANALGRDLNEEIKFADKLDFLVRELPNFPFEFKDLETLLSDLPDDPLEIYHALARYRFEKLGELAKDYPFSLEAIMIYLKRLMIAWEWYNLNEGLGSEKLTQLVG